MTTPPPAGNLWARDERRIAKLQADRHRRRYGGWYRAGIQLVAGTHAALIFGSRLPRGKKLR